MGRRSFNHWRGDMQMDLKALLKNNENEIIAKLQKAISFRSVREDDGSGYPYGQGVQDCLQYMLDLGRELGFRTVNVDNQVGWCEIGEDGASL